MTPPHPSPAPSLVFSHPHNRRRFTLQAGAIGLLGLGTAELTLLRQTARAAQPTAPTQPDHPRSVIFIFLSGGLSQLESFDPKPDAPESIRGEFRAIPTRTPGLAICEHLPRLAACSHLWSVVRSLTHPSNDHSLGHHIMLTGRSDAPIGFDPNRPGSTDHPSIASVVTAAYPPRRNNLPPAIVLPERLIHNTGRVIPGQFGGALGARRDPWFLEISPFDPASYGAYPAYEFDHQQRPHTPRRLAFEPPSLTLPEGFGPDRLHHRIAWLDQIDQQRRTLDDSAATNKFDQAHASAVSLLVDPSIRQALDIRAASPQARQRYGDHAYGWSLLLARKLVERQVPLIQVNLGNNETWDTHGNAFPHLKDKLLPPMDQSVAALLQDLFECGLLASTLVVMAGEFGRTPRISHLREHYKLPGRDHWGRAQSVLIAGGGTQGGRVIGATDRIASEPIADPQTPENLAASIYHALGIPPETLTHDDLGRPFALYHGKPIAGLV